MTDSAPLTDRQVALIEVKAYESALALDEYIATSANLPGWRRDAAAVAARVRSETKLGILTGLLEWFASFGTEYEDASLLTALETIKKYAEAITVPELGAEATVAQQTLGHLRRRQLDGVIQLVSVLRGSQPIRA